MARRDDLEIIEVLDPDDPSLDWHVARGSPFSPVAQVSQGASPDAEPADRRRPPWPWIALAGVAVAAVMAVVVSIVADDPAPDPPPALADGKYLIDDPSLRSYSADIVTPPDDGGYFALLAQGAPEDGWLSVTAQRFAPPPAVLDSSVEVVQGVTMARADDGPARSAVVLGPYDGWTVLVRSQGLADAEVSNFSRALRVEPSSDGVRVTWGVPGSGRAVVATARNSDEALFGRVDTRMTYLDDRADVITLRVASGTLAQHERTLSYLASPTIEHRDGRLSATLADTSESVVMWEQDGHLLSLTGAIDRATLLALSKDVRQATGDEWQTRLIFLRPDYRVGDFTALGDGDGWVAGVQRAERGGTDKFLWWFTVPSDRFTSMSVPMRFDPTTTPFADHIVVDGVTYVLVSMPGSSGVTTATVYSGAGPGVDLTLRRAFVDVDAVFAVHRVDDPGEVRVFSAGVQAPQLGLLPDPLSSSAAEVGEGSGDARRAGAPSGTQ